MDVIFHGHHAAISERMRKRAEAEVRSAAAPLPRAVDAVIRFEQDGPVRRVEILLHAPRQRDLVATGEAKFYGPALASAVGRLTTQVRKVRAMRRATQRESGTGRTASA